uniref:Zinc finger, C3HC4 type domain containing protein n=1 Tax=Babesia bovis TaxID=5865 RepID=S6BMH4_BABBO|nr:zinc finger, C3HC4 type domain containing protein [Babesia bovis]
METFDVAGANSPEGSLGDRLRSRNRYFQSVTEFFIGLDSYTTRRYGSYTPDSDVVMDFVVHRPVRVSNFVRAALFIGIVMNIFLCFPDVVVMLVHKTVVTEFDPIVLWWLTVNKSLQCIQLPIRMFLVYLLYQLKDSTNQEIIYCMAVITTSRLWSWSKRLTLAHFFCYVIGFVSSRYAMIMHKAFFTRILMYVFSMMSLRMALTFLLFYYSFPPSQMRRPNKPRPKVDTSKNPLLRFGDLDEPKYTMCGICLDDFEEETEVRMLKCSHGYHDMCIEKWFNRSNACPLCLAVVTDK